MADERNTGSGMRQVGNMIAGKRQRKHLNLIYTLLIVVLAFVFLFRYLSISNDEMPLMDFWLGFDTFAERVFTNQLTLEDFIQIPHALHWTAIGVPIQSFFVKYLHSNNMAYIICGGFELILCVLLLRRWQMKYADAGNCLINFIFCIALASCAINLNQWEILDLWCSVSFYLRIFIYYVMFSFTDSLLHSNSVQKGCTKSLLWGICGALAILCVSAAYYPGFVVAVSVPMILGWILKKQTSVSLKSVLPGLIVLCLGTVAFFFTTANGSELSNGTSVGAEYIKGFFVMLGSTVVPQSMSSSGLTSFVVIGVIIFLLAVESVVVFFKDGIYLRTWFPLECMIYAFVSIVVIIYGRANTFGLGTLTSSRYVVESTVGLCGVAAIQVFSVSNYLKKQEKFKSFRRILVPAFILLTITGMIAYANVYEYGIGPYRKVYNQNMINAALDIDNVTDEELSIFQAPAKEVRSGIAAMKKYRLNVWNENSAYYPRDGFVQLDGFYQDGWVGPDSGIRIASKEGGQFIIKGLYDSFSDSGEKIEIYDGNEMLIEHTLTSKYIDIIFDVDEGFDETLQIKSNFSFVQYPDVRALSFKLEDMRLVEYSPVQDNTMVGIVPAV